MTTLPTFWEKQRDIEKIISRTNIMRKIIILYLAFSIYFKNDFQDEKNPDYRQNEIDVVKGAVLNREFFDQ
jgi:hypothetical protein